MEFFNKIFKRKAENKALKIEISTKEIESLSHFDLLNKIFQYNFNREYKLLSEGEKAIHNFFIISGQVGNGGFTQLFGNTKDKYIGEGKRSFSFIGNKKLQIIFEEAVKIFQKNKELYFDDQENKVSKADMLMLCALDDRFFKLDKEIDEELYRLVMSKKEDFMRLRVI